MTCLPACRQIQNIGAVLLSFILILGTTAGRVIRSDGSVAPLLQKKDKKDKKDSKARPAAEPPNRSDPTTSLISLGEIYYASGYYNKAEPLFKNALEYREQTLGPNHPAVAEALNYLGLVYNAMGDYAKSEQSHLRALQIREKTLGPDHNDVAVSLNNLAGLYDHRG